MVIEESELDSFEKEFAEPEKIKEIKKFFKRDSSEEGDSKNLFSGLDFTEKSGYVGSKRSFETIKIKLNKELFPPCMKRISEGLDDGRKRALFSLVNFYKKFDIEWETLEIEIYAWNEKNRPALKKGYIKAQLDWHRRQSKRIPPPNCKDYYKEIGVCFPDNICQKIRNPLTYVTIKQKD